MPVVQQVRVPEGSTPSRAVLIPYVVLFLIVALAAVLRFHAIGQKNVWIDEGVSIEMARLDWYNFLRILWRHEANMALYTVLLRGWLHFGQSEAFIRALSASFALATLPAIYIVGRKLFSERVGLLAAFLLAINTYHIRYSQEARSYALYPLLCIFSSIYFLKYLGDPTRRNRVGHVLTSALAVYAHFFAGFVVVAQWLAARLLDRQGAQQRFRRNWRQFAIAISPLVLFVLTTGTGVLRWIPRPHLMDLANTFLFFTGNGGWWLVLLYSAAVIGALISVRGWMSPRISWDSWRYRYLLIWLFFPILLVFAVSQLKHIYLARYFIFCLPALILLAAAGLGRLRSNWALAAVLAVIAFLSLRGVTDYYRKDFDIGREDWRSATHHVLDHAQTGDVLILHQPIGRMPYEYYRSRIQANVYPTVIYPAHDDTLTYRDFYAGHAPDSFLQMASERYARVWVIFTYNDLPTGPDPTTQFVNAVFGRAYASKHTEEFPGIQVQLYSRAASQ
jgi:mannosyltransferase